VADKAAVAAVVVAAVVAVAAAGSAPAPGDFASARPAGTASPTSKAPRVLT
jgi:hypothetical protein